MADPYNVDLDSLKAKVKASSSVRNEFKAKEIDRIRAAVSEGQAKHAAFSQQQDKENEKTFLGKAKKLREIRKIETQATPVEANQKVKLEQKGALLEEIANLDVGPEIWEKADDVLLIRI